MIISIEEKRVNTKFSHVYHNNKRGVFLFFKHTETSPLQKFDFGKYTKIFTAGKHCKHDVC